MKLPPVQGGTFTKILFAAVTAAVFTAVAILAPEHAAAQTGFGRDPQDEVLEEVGVDEHLGEKVPLGIMLNDHNGKKVRLGDYFTGTPVVLSLNYYECPMLCPLTFRNLTRTIGEMGGLELGRDFRVVTVSINPDERQEMAADKAALTYGMLPDVKDPSSAWPFLYDGQGETALLADSVGYRFRKLGPDNFAHPSVFVVLSPDGTISRYLYGLEVPAFDLRLALTEAASGKIGGSHAINKVLLYCFHYDPEGRKYQVAALRMVTALGVVVVIGLGVLLAAMWRKERAGPARKDT